MTESDVKTTSNSKEIEPIVEAEEVKSNQGTVAIIVIAVILIAIIAGIIVLSLQEAGTVTKVRDLSSS